MHKPDSVSFLDYICCSVGAMEEMEGTYRVLQTPGARLGAQTNAAISTLEPEQSLSVASSLKARGRGIQLVVQLLDDVQEQVEVEVRNVCSQRGSYCQFLFTENAAFLRILENMAYI